MKEDRSMSRVFAFLAAISMAGYAHGAFVEMTDVVQLDVGGKHACALTSTGAVKCWGHNANGELGDGSQTSRAWAADVLGFSSGAAAIAVSHGWEERALGSHSCAITAAGAVKCWGSNESGQLGIGMVSAARLGPQDEVSGLGGQAIAIAAGWRHSCALLLGGGVKCWGANEKGQLGDGTQTERLVATDVVGLSNGVVEITAGALHTCALTSLGTVKCWGENLPGSNASAGTSSQPVDVPGLSGIASASAGGTARRACGISGGSVVFCEKSTIGYFVGGGHACAVTAAGGAQCWGNNEHGQVGDGTQTNRGSAVDVVGLGSGIAGISAGGWSLPPVPTPCLLGTCAPGGPIGYTCAATSAGTAKCWGANYCGVLGNGGTAKCGSAGISMTPVDVAGLSGVEQIAAGGEFACAVAQGGKVRCWGLGYGSDALPVFSSTTPQGIVPEPAPGPTRLAGISTRVDVLSGDEVMIAGFAIGGAASKTVMVRATGPSLLAAGLTAPIANPMLTIVRASDQSVIATSDNWITAPDAGELQASGRTPTASAEPVLVMSLASGGYTAIVSGSDGSTGVGLVEVYEVDHPEVPLSGISTRGRVQSGDKVMIGGFAISGSTPLQVIVRARGPSLASEGLVDTLENPVLQLVRASDQAILATNDNWRDAPNAAEIEASGFAPGNRVESAILMTLGAGLYTAIVSGPSGDAGIAIVEVYAVPSLR
jgi:alpha-tubulin suppressor-like RCC1 family protein